MLLSQWLAHHHHLGFWDNPNRFEPERSSTDCGQVVRVTLSFLSAAGNLFAPTEAQIVLAKVAQKCRQFALADHPIELQLLVTLRPRHGIRVTLERRQTKANLASN